MNGRKLSDFLVKPLNYKCRLNSNLGSIVLPLVERLPAQLAAVTEKPNQDGFERSGR